MDESAWDDVCVNPQKQAFETGKKEGREAGLATGFREGQSIGIVKGVEYGMEIGFIRGVVQEVLEWLSFNKNKKQVLEDSSLQLQRIQKTAQALQTLLDECPSPDQIFSNNSQEGSTELTNNKTLDDDSNDHDSEQEPESNSSDVTRQMQAIRSKLKLLTVQLRWNSFSLKNVMNSGKIALSDETVNATTLKEQSQTTDW